MLIATEKHKLRYQPTIFTPMSTEKAETRTYFTVSYSMFSVCTGNYQ